MKFLKSKDRSTVLSVALIGSPKNLNELLEIENRVKSIRDGFEFVELLFIDHVKKRPDILNLLKDVPDCRFIWVDNSTQYYAMRSISANEAIGDRVLIANSSGFANSEAIDILRADQEEDFVFFRRKRGLQSLIFRALSSLSSYDIDPSYTTEMIVRKRALHKLNHLHEKGLAFRFPNSNNAEFNKIIKSEKNRRGKNTIRRRAALLIDVIFSSITSIFIGLCGLSVISAVLGAAYMIYAIIVYASDVDVQPGWFSTSVMLSMFTVVFSLFVFSASVFFIYFSNLLKQSGAPDYEILLTDDELRLFSKLKNETNVVG